jgi:hypothetical protein
LPTNYVSGQSLPASEINDITTAINDVASGATPTTGMVLPVRCAAVGGETYTVASGHVTEIAGTTINGKSMSTGHRILVMGAPATTGAGVDYNTSNSAANGLYVVTGTSGGNTQVARTDDMSGSVHPLGITVFTQGGTWTPLVFYSVESTDSGSGTFVYGTNMMWWAGTGGRNLNINGAYFAAITQTIGISNGTGGTYLQPTANAGSQNLYFPPGATGTIYTGGMVNALAGGIFIP